MSEKRTHSMKLHELIEQSYYKTNHFNERPHILYCLMIENAIIKLKDRNGSAQGVNTQITAHIHPGRVRGFVRTVCMYIFTEMTYFVQNQTLSWHRAFFSYAT